MKPLRHHLHFIDFVMLTLIFFGVAIYSSTTAYTALVADNHIAPPNLAFDAQTTLWGIIGELFYLLAAWVYLYWRRFDFKQLNFQIHKWTLPKTALYILLAGSVATVWEMLQYAVLPQWYPDSSTAAVYTADSHFAAWSPSFVAFALLNGFFEELFFIGLVVQVKPQHRAWAVGLSLMVRFAFHTYQGLAGAVTITTLGVVFLLLRRKSDELWPFMLAHAFFDLFGLGLPLYWLD